ncbi:hypothetical protein [Natranaerobius trueperi]|uniref:hypothetical protein n=1 Tax=Natranaerobius trueperi TaxID=759412 RepID=UPI00117F4BE9|nr:hypothetical protein [Natranaerobius trueperi]
MSSLAVEIPRTPGIAGTFLAIATITVIGAKNNIGEIVGYFSSGRLVHNLSIKVSVKLSPHSKTTKTVS